MKSELLCLMLALVLLIGCTMNDDGKSKAGAQAFQNASANEPKAVSNASMATPEQPSTIENHERYILLVPNRTNLNNDSIIIVAFSPSGDANSAMQAWRTAALKRGWPVFASKTYRNGELSLNFSPDTISDIKGAAAALNYPDPKFVFTGLSGGGQVSHAFAFGSPKVVTAVVTNCGIINPGFYDKEVIPYYPHNKTVLFIASPTDFRYEEMKKDKAFLESIGWKTGWMEFEGGHTVAPEAIYEHAADWLEQEIGNGTKN